MSRGYLAIITVAALFLTEPCRCAFGQEPPAAPIRFRREYLPVDRIGEWPLGGIRYRPTRAEEFERMVRQLEDSPDDWPGRVPARLASASYEARLVGDELVDGRGTLVIEHSAKTPTLLPLAPCEWAVQNVAWQGTPPAEAVRGLDAGNRLAILVERPGTLLLDWTLRGRRESADAWTVDLALPSSVSNVLLLDLPSPLAPVVSAGVVSGPTAAKHKGYRRWRLELGGHPRVNLKVGPGDVSESSPPLTLVRQSFTYEFSQSGITLAATLDLEALQQPLRRVEVALDPGLQLVAARYRDVPIDWTLAAAGDSRRVVFELPEPLLGARRVLSLRASTPLVMDERWKLPSLRPLGLSWQQGRATLRVPAPLVLNRLEPIRLEDGQAGGRQVETTPLPPPSSGESIVVEYYSERATVEVEVVLRQPRMSVAAGTTLDWSPDEIAALSVVDLDLSQGKSFTVEAEVPFQWTIDSVNTEPFDAIADWNRISSGRQTDRLVINLSTALSRSRPLRMMVTGRLLRPPLGEPLRLAELEMIAFPGAARQERLLGIRADGEYRLQLSNAAGLSRQDPEKLDVAWLERLNGSTFDLLTAPASGGAQAGISLERQKPQYTAETLLEVAATDGPLWQSCLIRCQPQAARGVERLLVYLPHLAVDPPKWTLEDETDSRAMVARRLPAEEYDAAGVSPEGELWELVLRTPRREPFAIRGRRLLDFESGSQFVGLPTLPEAASQRGTLIVRGIGRWATELENHGLKPIPLSPRAGDLPGIIRAAFRTEAESDSAGSGYLILARRTAPDPLPGAVAWLSELESRYDPQGQAEHLATFQIQNSSLGGLDFQLPPRAALEGVWVDSEQVPQRDTASQFAVFWPVNQRFATVRIHYRTQESPLGVIERLSAQRPEINIPVLHSRITVWTPPGFEVLESDAAWDTTGIRPLSWTQRIFGPLGRPGEPTPADAEPQEPERTASSAMPSVEVAGPLDGLGWHVYRFEGSGTSVTLSAVRVDALQTFAWAGFLVAIAIGWWLAKRRMAVFAGALSMAMSLALVIPASLSMIASGVVLGLLIAGVCHLAGFGLSSNRSDPLSTVSRAKALPMPGAAAGILVAGLLAALLSKAAAQPPAPPILPVAETVYRVLIPVDDKRQPVADGMYQVPVALYRELRERVDRLSGAPRGWLLGPATYRGALAHPLEGRGLTLSQFTASYQLRTFEPAQRVRISLGQSNGQRAAETVLLNGSPIPAAWDAETRQLSFEVPEAGVHRLEAQLRPNLHAADGAAGFELSIPPLVESKLELMLPPGAPALDVITARGAVDLDEAAQMLRADLGPTATLVVRWREDDPAGGSGPKIEVDQLLWLKVQPGSTLVEVQLRYRIAAEGVRRLYVSADPRLGQLRDWHAPNLRDWQKRDLPGIPRAFVLNFTRPVSGPLTIDATFSLEGTSSVGNLRMPRLDPLWADVQKRWLAVSLDPSLEVVAAQGTEIANGEFAAVWGGGELKPKIFKSFNLAPGLAWSLATRPKEPTRTAEQVLSLSIGPQQAEVRFEANLVTQDAPVFQHQLLTPRDLAVQRISIVEHETQRNPRWSRDESGRITVFLSGPAGAQKLVLIGTLPVKTPGEILLPEIQVVAARLLRSQAQVFRRPGVLVEIKEALPLEEQRADDLGRLVAEFDLPVDGLLARTRQTLKLRPNQPQLRGEQVTTLLRQDGRWLAQLDFHVIDVQGGVADALLFDVPASWPGPYELTPPMPAHLLEVPGESQRQLVIEPRGPIDGAFKFSIRGPLLAGENRLSVPLIAPRPVRSLEQYLALPAQFEMQQAAWETRGLEKAELPDDFNPPLSPSHQVTRVVSKNFQAHLLSIDRSAAAEIRLAEVLIVHGADQSPAGNADGKSAAVGNAAGQGYRGLLAFDIEPSNLSQCVVEVPPDCRPLLFQVAGLAADARQVSASVWRIPLGPGQFPQRVEILFAGDLPAHPPWSRSLLFSAPRVTGLPIRNTVWSIHGLPRGGDPLSADVTLQTASEQDLERIKCLTELIDQTSTLTADEPVDEVRNWYEAWAGRLSDAAAGIQQRMIDNPNFEDNAEHRVLQQKLLSQRQYWAQVLGDSPSGAVVAREFGVARESRADGSTSLKSLLPVGPEAGLCLIAGGASGALSIRVPAAAAYESYDHLVAACGLLAITSLLAVRRRSRWAAAAWIRRWIHGVLAASGIAWWLWLEPSFLGLLLVALALWNSLRGGWTRNADWPSSISSAAPPAVE